MKKILLMIVPLMALIGCSYDDTDIQKRLDDLDGQLTELQALVKALNSDVTTLKELVAGKRFISDVQPGEDGGYVITLVTAAGETSTITISDGKDGTSSVIGVKQDSDGVYYWTLNGDFILDNGKKLPVSGVTPEFKIENSHWWVSYDNGATWTDCGQAQTDQNLFKSVATSEDGKLVYLTLADGTVLTFELYVQFGIAFDTASATIRVGETAEIPFTLTGADAKTDIQALADGAWKAEVKRTGNEGGTIAVTAPGDSSTGKVIVLVSDGDAKTLMRTLTFVSGVLNVSTSSKEATAAGGPVTVEVETDLDYTVAIPEAAKAWITLAETRGGEIRTETLTFNVAANTETQSRSANIELVAGETVIETILIYQEAYYDPAQMVLKVEAKEYSSSAYNNKVYLPLYGAVDVTVNWGDGQSEPVAATISTAAAMVNHTYAESGIYYVTISGTTEKLSGRLTNKTVAPAILEVRQWGKLGMTTLDYAFANTSLVTVPQPEEDAFAAVTTVEYMFSGCAALETVPEGLLAGAPESRYEVEGGHGGDGREDVDAEITHVVHAHQQDRTDQRTDRAADEVNARPESGLLDGVTAAFDQQLRRYGIHPHVDADDEDDPEEEEEYRAVFQQGERRTDRRGLRRFGLFADGGAHEPCGREQRDEREDREEVLPVAQRAGGECGDEGAAERRDRLDDLACGQRTGQRVPLDHVGEQRVERHLEDRIADAQQHECRHARGKVVVYERDQHTDGRDAVADLYHVLAAEAVHGEGRRNRKQQEPDENHRGDESGEGLAEPEILLDIAGRDTDHVAEAHDEETEQDGQ